MIDQWKVLSHISIRDYRQRFSPSQISDTPRAWFELAQNLISGSRKLRSIDKHYTATNQSKPITSWKIIKNTIRLCKGSFPVNVTKICKTSTTSRWTHDRDSSWHKFGGVTCHVYFILYPFYLYPSKNPYSYLERKYHHITFSDACQQELYLW